MALDTLTGMAIFRQVVELGSISAAARHLDLSAEMAGHHLRALERRLGVRLVNRTTRRMHVTEAGEAYYRRCVAVLDEVALADAEAGRRRMSPAGRVRLAAPLAFANAMLADPVGAFTQAYPDIELDIDLSERNVGIVDEGFDLALRLGALKDSSLIARRLAAYPLLAVAAPAYLARHDPIGHPQDLSQHAALIYSQTAEPRVWRFTEAAGEHADIRMRGAIAASDVAFLLRLALAGQGVFLAPSFLVADHVARGELTILLQPWRTRLLPLSLLMPHRTLVPAAVQALSAFLADWFSARRDGLGKTE